METEIKELVNDLKKEIVGKEEIIALVYNPFKSGMEYPDCLFLKHLFDIHKYTSPLFLLNGHGGSITAGIYFPNIIKQSVKNYYVYIPRFCCSALCYTLLKANKLFIGENTTITQIDPTFEYQGQILRAIKIIKEDSNDLALKDFALEVFNFAIDETKRLIEAPSLFRDKEIIYSEHLQMDDLASLFMNKEGHDSIISTKELIGLGAKIVDTKNTKLDNIANRLIQKCQDFTIQNNVRAIFISSIPIALPGEPEGLLICPLD